MGNISRANYDAENAFHELRFPQENVFIWASVFENRQKLAIAKFIIIFLKIQFWEEKLSLK